MVEAAPPRVAELVVWAAGKLTGRVVEPRRTALSVLAHLLGGPLEVFTATTVENAEVVGAYQTLIARLADGEPLPYVLGETGFRTLRLRVGSDVLIPRPETEGLVQLALDRAGNRAGLPEPRALDLGTGSGCIALSLAAEGRFSLVIATDVSRAALEVASRNAQLNDLTDVEFREGPFFEPVSRERFDLIIANPPYIAPDEYAHLDESVRRHEPRGALVSDAGGLEHTRTILAHARDRLATGGLLALEIDSRRARESHDLAVRYGWQHALVREDSFGRPRFLVAEAGHRG